MLISMLVAAMSVNRMLLQRLLGGWAFALAFRREAFASLDVSYTASTAMPPCRRCRVNGPLLDELMLVTGLALLLGTKPAGRTLRKAPRYGCISWWRWRLRCAHHTGGLARLVRVGRGERRARAP